VTRGLMSLVLGLACSHAVAQTTPRCASIDHVPFVIERSGCYRVARDLVSGMPSGDAILVRADNVLLDLDGHGIENRAGIDTRARGIAGTNLKNVTIRDGWVQGFRYGVSISDSRGRSEGHRIQDLRVLGSRACGIYLSGVRSVVTRCQVDRTGGRGPIAVGIAQAGGGDRLTHNRVTRTHADDRDGYAAGMELAAGFKRIVAANRVRAVRGGRASHGIRCGLEFAAENDVAAASVPFSSCAAPDRPHPFPFPYPPPPL
jgi:hypothetical protein